jgi:phytol kinase
MAANGYLPPIIQDIIATVITFVLVMVFLRVIDVYAHKGKISSFNARKIRHIGVGPIFILCWMIYSDFPLSRLFAALVPLAITTQFFLIGSGKIKDDVAVKGMSRSGDAKELLRGPVYFGLACTIITLVFWMHTVEGIVALAILCVGDGFAELFGRQFGTVKLPTNQNKSWAGSLAMLILGFLAAIALLAIFINFGKISVDLASSVLPVFLVSLVATVVESLPIRDFDNFTVPTASILTTWVLIAIGFWQAAFI